MEKLDNATARHYEQNLADPKKVPAFGDLLRYIEERADAIEASGQNIRSNQQAISSQQGTSSAPQRDNNKIENNTKCIQCKADHALTKCEAFSKLDVKERFEKIKSEKLCRMCFKNHHTDKCN